MVTFIPFGEKPNREGVLYAKKLLEKEGLLEEDVNIVDARNTEVLDRLVPFDCCYVIGEHLATYSIIGKLRPSSLISVDAHTDLMHDYLDHGSWLAYSLEERRVERAAVIAPVLMIPTTKRTELWTRRVRIYPALPRTRKTPKGWRSYLNLTNHGVGGVVKDAEGYLGKDVYLTVDLDVLRPEYRVARFQHGELTLDELLGLLGEIVEMFNVVAFDVAEVSDRLKRSRLGKEALIEVFRLLREG